MQEIWKDITWFEWLYQVSNLWRVNSLNYNMTWKEKILKPWTRKNWHSFVNLCKNWVRNYKSVSRLVALHFIPNPNNLPCVCHKDETLDERWALYNWEDNLFWGTHSDNSLDMHKKWRWYSYFKLNPINKWKGIFWKDHFNSKPVNQYTKDGIFIKEWGSIVDASNETTIHKPNISEYIWML